VSARRRQRRLARYAESLGIAVDHPGGTLTLGDGATIAFAHGHDEQVVAGLLAQSPRWFFHGHSHQIVDRRQDGTRVINPGALFRARRYTAALVDTDAEDVEFLDVAGH